MNVFTKRLCILNQINTGFSLNEKSVSGLARIELYANYLTFDLSLINFAPPSSGRFICAVTDDKHTIESFEVEQHGTYYRKKTELNIDNGVSCIIFFVNGTVSPIASGQFGNIKLDIEYIKSYISKKYPSTKQNNSFINLFEQNTDKYQDDLVATENYFEYEKHPKENNNEPKHVASNNENEICQREIKKEESKKQEQKHIACNEADKNLFSFTSVELGQKQGQHKEIYYDSIKDELTALFNKHPAEVALQKQIANSKWIKVFFAEDKFYTVGIISENAMPKYICYGVPAKRRIAPPEALKGYCSYLPLSPLYLDGEGYWMMYQDARNGACVKIDFV